MTLRMSLRITNALFLLIASLISYTSITAQSARLPSLGTVRDVDYDRASGTFVAGGDNGLYVWKPGSNEEPKRLTNHQVAGLAIAPNGNQLAYGDPEESFWVTLPENKPVRPLNLRVYQGVDFDFSDDGKTLLTIEWEPIAFHTLVPTILILRTSDGSVIQRYEDIDAFSATPWAAKLSPNGHFLAIYTKEGAIRVYDNHTGKTVLEDQLPRTWDWHLIQFSNDGRHVAFRDQEGVRLYSTDTWEQNTSLPSTWGQTFDLSDDGELLATGSGLVLPIAGGPPRFDLQLGLGHFIQYIRLSPSGKLLLAMTAISDRIQVWNIETKERLLTEPAGSLFNERKFYGDFLPDESGVIFSTASGTFRVAHFYGDSGTDSETIVSLRDITHLHFDDSDTNLRLIDLDHGVNGKPTVRSLNIKSDAVSTLQAPNLQARAAYSPNGRWLGIIDRNGQGKLEIWDHGQGEPVVSFTASFTGYADSFAIADDGQTAAIGLQNGRITIWPGSSRRRSKTLPNQGFVRGLTFAPESNHLAAMTSEGWVYVINAEDREILWEQKVKSDFQFHLAPTFSPDGSLLAVNGEDKSRVWDWESDNIVFATATRNTTRSFAFSHDLRFLAIGAYTDVEVFQLSTRRRLARFTFSGFTEGVNSVALSSDLQTLAAGTGNGDLRLWSLEGRLPAPPAPNLQIAPESLHSVRLEWPTPPSHSLRLEASADLINWVQLEVEHPGSIVVDTELIKNRFFRLISE